MIIEEVKKAFGDEIVLIDGLAAVLCHDIYPDQELIAAPKHSNPNLLPIGETFGFVVFLKDVK